MHKLYLLFILFCLIGCSFESELKISQKDTINENKYFQIKRPLNNSLKLEVVIVDGCEYLYGYVGGNGGYVLCHKGNCNNLVHVYNKETTRE